MGPILDLVAGARPNFMKLAPVVRGLGAHPGITPRIVHTGQHYDPSMTNVFFRDLGIPAPEVHLDVGSGTHGAQTARILERYESHLMQRRPSGSVVFGDVNSTVACALAAVKLGVPVAHVEAGLRSFDRTMPEEINRLLTDAVADLLLVSEPSGVTNLQREGVDDSKIRLVGNVMIDSLVSQLPVARERRTAAALGLDGRRYGFVTLHRPSNVDDAGTLGMLLQLLHELAQRLTLVFALHPRTAAAAQRMGIESLVAPGQHDLICVGPQSYIDTVSLMSGATVVLTDSGGLQEESSVLRVPCLTLRENTERPITVTLGTSRLVGNDPVRIRSAFADVLEGRWTTGQPIPLWDGEAGNRVATELAAWVHQHNTSLRF
ncbi:MAG TPA: UDP-N-acetylglucosamine 2-epimerase (non-hydrolyzing) [Vicinamibacterales bacterium]|jgi:UDP-N-acetylglucosamine 2-epimerase (non-hydrolysing)|nr:UDP-N-acetylglucosamine 2-epimerase (non-hydrolyzing) [Vicinamibacterales bacterium]